MGGVHRVLLWRGALGVSVCGAAFVHVGSAYGRTMIRGVFTVVKGGFSGIRCRMQGRIPAYAGMTGGGVNGGTQRRKDAMKSRRGIPAYAGMTAGARDTTGGGVGYDVMGTGMA